MTGSCRTGLITAQHGWGYDCRTYAPWQPLMPTRWELRLKNRGYFKESDAKIYKAQDEAGTKAQKILVAHSFGLHLLENDEIENCDLLVIISSFANFHLNDNQQSKKATRRMLMRLKAEPRVVLQDFYAVCTGNMAGTSPVLPEEFIENCNVDLLIADLKRLDEIRADLNKIAAVKSILILHGRNDAIVNIEAGKQLHERLPGSVLAINEEAGHALPLTHPQWCLDQIFTTIGNANVTSPSKTSA